jgi:hypothetical protein
MNRSLFLLAGIIIFSSCFTGIPKGDKEPINHAEWTALLKKYVDEDGLVDYGGFRNDTIKLNDYLAKLSNNAPSNRWSQADKLAYWINAYNAFTVKLITDNYPVKSIKDLGPANPIIFVNTVWDKKFFSIGGKEMTLNTIEHKILRKKFNDARMHFAINCASYSCPKLRSEAYEANKLDAQLTDQAKDFLADTRKNKVSENEPELSSIFKWFSKDFSKKGQSKIQFVNQFSRVKINENADISYLDYNWDLNDK